MTQQLPRHPPHTKAMNWVVKGSAVILIKQFPSKTAFSHKWN
jgi:hypothetical protein